MRAVPPLLIAVLLAGCAGAPAAVDEPASPANETVAQPPAVSPLGPAATCGLLSQRSSGEAEAVETTVRRPNYTEKVTERGGEVDCYRVERTAGQDPLTPRRGVLTTVELVGVEPQISGMTIDGLVVTLRNIGAVEARIDAAIVTVGDASREDTGPFGERLPPGESRVVEVAPRSAIPPLGTPLQVEFGFDSAERVTARFEPDLRPTLEAFPNITWGAEGLVPVRMGNFGNHAFEVGDFLVEIGGESHPGWPRESVRVEVGRRAWVDVEPFLLPTPRTLDPTLRVTLLGPHEEPVANATLALPPPRLTFLDVVPEYSLDCGPEWCQLNGFAVRVRNDAPTPVMLEITGYEIDGVEQEPAFGGGGVATMGVTDLVAELFPEPIPGAPFELTVHIATAAGESLADFTVTLEPPFSASSTAS